MDNLELKSWLELWRDERNKLLEITEDFSKKKKEQELLTDLFIALKRKKDEAGGQLEVLILTMHLPKVQNEIEENVRQLNELDKSVQLKRGDIMYIQEKMKIIEEKVGKELINNERDNLLKTII